MLSWLHTPAIVSLLVSSGCAIAIVFDLMSGRPQRMWIMNVVWPVTALYSGPLGLWAYYTMGRPKQGKEKPFWQISVVATTHCGAGCTLGDIAAEWFVFAVPVTLFGQKIFGAWALDFAAAYLLGIVFQYFTIAPMRGLGVTAGIRAAVKADSLSLTAWQIGMYGWMAIVHFGIFGEIPQNDPVFWFMMQIAMMTGFATSYPVNRWLVRAGLKEKM